MRVTGDGSERRETRTSVKDWSDTLTTLCGLLSYRSPSDVCVDKQDMNNVHPQAPAASDNEERNPS